ncbi:retrovirus-related pol polyprotein from transposon TNT 1-94 [Tanacetum coccineum]
MTESPLVDLGFAVHVFSPGDDPIACLNKQWAFLTAVASSRFPSTNNHLGMSSKSQEQRPLFKNAGNATGSGGNNASGQASVVKCYNCQGEGHMARQCTQPKRPRNVAWYKDKAMLAEAREAGQILDEEQLVFLADPGVPRRSSCSDNHSKTMLLSRLRISILMILPVSNSKTYLNDMDNQSVHALQDFEQSPVMNFTDNKISSDSNIIPYSQYLDILNEIMEVQTVFNQMDVAVQQSLVDKQCLEIAKKELLLENDRLLQQIMSQDVLLTVMNYMSLIGESVNMEIKRNESCDKCFNLDAELLKSQNASNNLLKSCPDCSLVSGLRMFETHDREPLSAHELSCALGKSKKTSHQPKAEDTNQEKLYLLHMDLCGPMRVASINGKRYILVIVDDYSRFTWVRFLRTKDEAPEAIIKCIKNIQVRLNAIVHNVRTNNETEFVNQILRELILD